MARWVLLIVLHLCYLLFGTGLASADETLKRQLNEKLLSPADRQSAIAAGQQRALLCSYCHGPDGNSIKPDTPNLAAQNPLYLLNQIEKFATAERKDYVMNSLAKQLTADDKVNLAIYYADQTVQRVVYNASLVSQGRELYRKRCRNCHGEEGIGKLEFARLAGQKPSYVSLTLKRFRDTAVTGQLTGKRRSEIMESLSKDLSNQQIEALAAYIAQLH